ncbi:MAG: hypothetical protein JO154_20645 [Chitinophaga sp.]|uniref:hypothetical protein n=1 Tax=Chitinophaga sp. TaxID=1869181 RepID=UPI0025BD7F18|nr:hypothetical protein [Chitinophaga sp.]MBV8255022.1 hypothetical protein [Chitinophaga sp.]
MSFRLLNAIGQDLVSGPSPTIPLQDINLKAGSTNMNLQISPSQSNTSNGYIYTNIKPVVPSPGAFVQMRLIVLVNGQPQVYNLNIQTVYDECCGHHVLGMTVNNGTFIPNDKGAMDITIAAGPRPN